MTEPPAGEASDVAAHTTDLGSNGLTRPKLAIRET